VPAMILKLTPSILLVLSLTGPALSQSAPTRSTMLYGNYCGPGNNAPLPPIDALDAACARHDACTPDGALAPKACHLRLQQEAARIAGDPRQPDNLKAMAGIVSMGAALMPAETAPLIEMPLRGERGGELQASSHATRSASFVRRTARD